MTKRLSTVIYVCSFINKSVYMHLLIFSSCYIISLNYVMTLTSLYMTLQIIKKNIVVVLHFCD